MVEFIARWLIDPGVSPLTLTRGYRGADESKMIQRHLLGTSAKTGAGANRTSSASIFLGRHGYIHSHRGTCSGNLSCAIKSVAHSFPDKLRAVILDDGMQHLALRRNLEIVMVNGLMPCGNCELVSLGPLREPCSALARVDIVARHHADLAAEDIKAIQSTIWNVKDSLPIFLSKMESSHLIKASNASSRLSLSLFHNMITLCVYAIGCAAVIMMEPKGYMKTYEVLVLCSCLRIKPREGQDSFKQCLRQHLETEH